MRILGPLFFIGAAVAAYFLFQNWRAEKEAQYWAGEMKVRLAPLAGKHPASVLTPDDAAVFQLLLFVDKAVNAGRELDKVLDDACDLLALSGELRTQVKAGVTANYDLARKFRVYDDLGNLSNIEHGEAPVLNTGGWEDQKIVVGQTLPPLLAPEAAQNIANLELMPEIVRDAHDAVPTRGTLERARKLRQAQIITPESLERIELLKLDAVAK